MGLGTAFLIALLCNLKNAEIVPATVIVLGLLGSGGVLYWIGSKKKS